jgi:hypothetical protein
MQRTLIYYILQIDYTIFNLHNNKKRTNVEIESSAEEIIYKKSKRSK